VALNTNVYLWNAGTGNIQHLLTLEDSNFVCSVSWIQEGNCLAVGTNSGVTQVCYVTESDFIFPTPEFSIQWLKTNYWKLHSRCFTRSTFH